jgi:PAS domain S-box-containing protein
VARNIPENPAFTPWREAAIQRGYKSIIALPLISEGQTLGVLEIYSVNMDAFDVKEVEILKELADDLAFGITALRTRVKRDQTEVELSESEERYRLITENTADTIAIVDLNLNPTYISPSILKLLGYTVQEAMTKTLNQILTPDSLQKASKIFADQMALESSPTADPARTVLMELEQYCKDGSLIWVELAASFLRDNNFKPTGILTVTRDITERKQAEELQKETLARLRKAIDTTIEVLVSAIESRDPYTAGHQRRSTNLACAIATEMGLTQEKIDGIRMAGSIHDIGKLSIPSEILSKPAKLTNIEFLLIKEHPRKGHEMLKNVESPWPLAEIVLQHHERLNGTGYPKNLKGDEIIMEARIVALADVVETMASHRPYRPALGIEVALEEIEKNKGILYDNAVADTCLKLFREKGYQLT